MPGRVSVTSRSSSSSVAYSWGSSVFESSTRREPESVPYKAGAGVGGSVLEDMLGGQGRTAIRLLDRPLSALAARHPCDFAC